MKEINQTKEGFIKSMFLFVVLLFICFAPFFAFASTIQMKTGVISNEREVIKFTSDANEIAPKLEIQFQSNRVFNQTQFTFNTNFECSSYAIEGFNQLSSSYESILYCNDALCVDPQETVKVEFPSNELNFLSYRVKVTLADGSTLYSDILKEEVKEVKEISLTNTAVSDKLMIDWNGTDMYTYSISDINGIEYCSNQNIVQSSQIELIDLTPGFYIISFKSADGKIYHDKFLKQ
jgi:hypothetical protein